MDLSNLQTTNLLLLLLTLLGVVQLALLVVVLFAVRSSIQQARASLSALAGGDVHQLHDRLMRLLADVERLVAKSNTVVGAVERGARDLGTAAAMVTATTHRAVNVSSMQAAAVTTAVRAGVRWLVTSSPWFRRFRRPPLPPLTTPDGGLSPSPRTY